MRSLFTWSQPEQVFELGNHRSATTSAVPYQAALYSSCGAAPERRVGYDPGQLPVGEHPGGVEVLDDHADVPLGEVGELRDREELSVRDVGVLLDVSPQRVSQLTKA